MELYKLITCILGEAAFSLWRLDEAHVDLGLVRASEDIGDFKIQQRDGNENVTLKENLRSFSLYLNYSYLFF